MTTETTTPTEAETARGGEPVLPPDALLGAAADHLVEQAKAEGVALTGEGGLLTGLVQRVLQGALEAEITDHLGYPPHAVEGRGSGNSRNGHYPKTVRTEIGDVAVKVPRDRNGSFEPATIPVGQRRLSGLDQMVISVTSGNRSTRRWSKRGETPGTTSSRSWSSLSSSARSFTARMRSSRSTLGSAKPPSAEAISRLSRPR